SGFPVSISWSARRPRTARAPPPTTPVSRKRTPRIPRTPQPRRERLRTPPPRTRQPRRQRHRTPEHPQLRPAATRRHRRTRGADLVAISIGVGGKKKVVEPAMNVTPLVDVVLVLLIIFMVVTPLLSKDFWVHLPKQEKQEIEPEQLPDDPVP